MTDTKTTDDEWPGMSKAERRRYAAKNDFSITWDPDRVATEQLRLDRGLTMGETFWLNRPPWIPGSLLNHFNTPVDDRGERR